MCKFKGQVLLALVGWGRVRSSYYSTFCVVRYETGVPSSAREYQGSSRVRAGVRWRGAGWRWRGVGVGFRGAVGGVALFSVLTMLFTTVSFASYGASNSDNVGVLALRRRGDFRRTVTTNSCGGVAVLCRGGGSTGMGGRISSIPSTYDVDVCNSDAVAVCGFPMTTLTRRVSGGSLTTTVTGRIPEAVGYGCGMVPGDASRMTCFVTYPRTVGLGLACNASGGDRGMILCFVPDRVCCNCYSLGRPERLNFRFTLCRV